MEISFVNKSKAVQHNEASDAARSSQEYQHGGE